MKGRAHSRECTLRGVLTETSAHSGECTLREMLTKRSAHSGERSHRGVYTRGIKPDQTDTNQF